MGNLARIATQAADSEYTIYTFEMGAGNSRRHKSWTKRDTKKEMTDALTVAENIFRTGKYGKVEVKQKYFDRRKNRKVDVTLKVFEEKNEKEIDVFAMFLFALVCAAAVFAATSIVNG